jgi:hypothetical protein
MLRDRHKDNMMIKLDEKGQPESFLQIDFEFILRYLIKRKCDKNNNDLIMIVMTKSLHLLWPFNLVLRNS